MPAVRCNFWFRWDAYVGEQLFDDLGKWVPDLTRHNIDAGHWVILSHPEKVAQLIADFAGGAEAKAPTIRVRLSGKRGGKPYLTFGSSSPAA